MPGFNLEAGGPDTDKYNKAETNRKHRWRFIASGGGVGGGLTGQDWIYLKKASRPQYKLETPEMHHNEEVAYFAGKRSWEPIEFEFYDVIDPNVSQKLYNWIAGGQSKSVTDVSGSTTAAPVDYKVEVEMQMLNGQGVETERWKLFGAWPSASNWGDLEYSDTEIALVTMTLKFDRASRIA